MSRGAPERGRGSGGHDADERATNGGHDPDGRDTNGRDTSEREAEGRDADGHNARRGQEPTDERGTPAAEPPPSEVPDPSRREVIAWLWRIPVLVAAGAGSWGLYEAIDTHFFKRRPDPTPTFADGPKVAVGTLGTFAEAWDAIEFAYEGEPAVALRLPGPIPGGIEAAGAHLAAFSRVCTHQGCLVTLNEDTEAIAFAFNYRADGPQFACPCHLSVFDPERAGRAVAGPAVLPLPRLRLAIDGDAVVATGREVAAEG